LEIKDGVLYNLAMDIETDTEKTESFEDTVNDFLTNEKEYKLVGDSWEQVVTLFDTLGETEVVLFPNSTENDLETYIHSSQYGNFYYTYKRDPQTDTIEFSLIKSPKENDN